VVYSLVMRLVCLGVGGGGWVVWWWGGGGGGVQISCDRPQISETGTVHVQDMHSIIAILGKMIYRYLIKTYRYGY